MPNALKSGRSTKKKTFTRDELVFFLPQFVIYITFTLLPLLVAIPIIFTDRVNFIDPEVSFIGLRNFMEIFRAPIVGVMLPALARTAIFTGVTFLNIFIIGLPLALIVFEFKSRLNGPFFTVVYMPYVTAPIGVGILLTMLFSLDSGTMNLLLLKLGILDNPINIVEEEVARWALPLMVGWRNAGFNMAILLSGLLTISDESIEASLVDGASYWQRLTRIYVPQIIPSIVIATIVTLLRSFGNFDIPVGFGGLRGNRSAYFLSVMLYQMGFGGAATQTATLAHAVTISFVVYLPLVIVAIALNRIQRRFAI